MKRNHPERSRSLADAVEVACPFCGQPTQILVDEGGGSHQTYVEDCQVCCRPSIVHLDASARGEPVVWLERDDGI